MDDKINVKITSEGDVAVAVFEAVSISNTEGVTVAAAQINKFVEEKQPNKMVFDFECVKFFSSQVLGLLLDVRAKLKAYDGEVVISAINPQLHRIFKITNLDKVFKFFPDKASALNAVETN
jgi:anti-sigma B factor antagonist